MGGALKVVVGDITKLEVDAVVNAANSRLAGGGGVDGAIHRAAGPGLMEACTAIGGCPTGEARVTGGFSLPARWIVHAVGPVWNGGGHGEPELLRSCYESSLHLARECGAASVAFPCISTGAYRYPKKQAAGIALEILNARRNEFDRLVVCCFGEEDAEIYRERAEALGISLN